MWNVQIGGFAKEKLVFVYVFLDLEAVMGTVCKAKLVPVVIVGMFCQLLLSTRNIGDLLIDSWHEPSANLEEIFAFKGKGKN